MNYKKYQHIEKLGTTEVEGILEGKVYLFYKIDGTNACIFLKDDNTLGFGSRNRELFIDNDNQGFAASVKLNNELYNKFYEILSNNPNYIIYGEWLIPNQIKRYDKEAWRKLYVFDIYDEENHRYLSYEEYKIIMDQYNINYIPPIATIENPSIDTIKEYLNQTGNYLISEGLGEGIVIKNYSYKNCYGRTTWAKILTDDFVNQKKSNKQKYHEDKEASPIEHQIVTNFLTPEFVQKEFFKFKEEKKEFNSKHIFEFINRTFIEFYKDNWELIMKKYKFPTINFKILKRLVEEEIKRIVFIG